MSAKAERAVEESQAGRALMPTSSLPWTRADTIFVGLQTLFITIVYARALRFDFVLDDFPLILQNPLVRANWKAIPRFFAEGYFERIFPQAPANDYRPLLSVWLLVKTLGIQSRGLARCSDLSSSRCHRRRLPAGAKTFSRSAVGGACRRGLCASPHPR